MTEKILPPNMDNFSNGMNNVDNIKKLPPNILNYLHNAYPDTSLKPLNGINDLASTDDLSDYLNGYGIVYVPVFLHINMQGAKTGIIPVSYNIDYLFIISQDVRILANTDDITAEYSLEIWNLSTGVRAQLFEYDYANQYVFAGGIATQHERVYFSLKKQYNSVYLTMSTRISHDHTTDYDEHYDVVGNKIFDFDVENETWIQRENGITVEPDIIISTPVYTPNIFDGGAYYSVCQSDSHIYRCGGTVASSGSPMRSTYYGEYWLNDRWIPTDFLIGGALIHYNNILWHISGRKSDDTYDPTLFYWAKKTFSQDPSPPGFVNKSPYRTEEHWFASDDPPWSDREGFKTIKFNGTVFVIGGRVTDGTYTDDTYYNTVYTSTNMTSWTLQTSGAIPITSGIAYFGITEYDDKLWIIGGIQWDGTDETLTNNVYNSTDGITWALVGSITLAEERHSMGCCTYNNKIWWFGGQDWSTSPWVGNANSDVYYSIDGITWTQSTSAACAIKDNDTTELVPHRGKMYAINSSKPYTSTDGETWSYDGGGLVSGNTGKFYSYAFTYVKRTDWDAFVHTDTYYENEYDSMVFCLTPWFTYNGQTVVGLDETLLTGTVALAADGALTGTGTLFTTELSVYDYIRINSSEYFVQVLVITDNTNVIVGNGDNIVLSGNYSLLPASGENISTTIFNPGICEGPNIISKRISIFVSEDGTNPILGIDKTKLNENVYEYLNYGALQGATHLRIYRTLGNLDRDVANGLDHRFLIDIALNVTQDTQYSTLYFQDTFTNTILEGSLNFLEHVGYNEPPHGRFTAWANNIFWVSGITKYHKKRIAVEYDNYEVYNGRVEYSVPPGTAGISFGALYPQKFGSMFNQLTQYKTYGFNNGEQDTGLEVLEGDLYLFKEHSIYVIYNADPTNNPVLLSEIYGCVCPNSIVLADIQQLGNKALFFISNEGMAYIQPGGKIVLFKEFKISYLEKTGGIMARSKTGFEGEPTNFYSKSLISCSYWDNTLWVIAGDYSNEMSQINEGAATNGRAVMFGFHFPHDNEGGGVFIRDFNTIRDKYEPRCLIPVDNRRAYTFSNRDELKITRFQAPTQYIDTLIENDTPENHNNTVKFITRAYNSDESYLYEWLMMKTIIYIDFSDTDTFTIKIYSDVNKQVATCSFSQERVSGKLSYSTFQYRDFITIIRGGDFERAFYHHFEITKQIPSDGDLEIHGVRFVVDNKLERQSPEHMSSFGAANNNQFVVEADSDPEVDAHV